jgi:hypothetical protein
VSAKSIAEKLESIGSTVASISNVRTNVKDSATRKALEGLLQNLQKLDSVLPVSHKWTFTNGVRVLKSSIPAQADFTLFVRDGYLQVVHRVVLAPIEEADCNPKKVAVILTSNKRSIAHMFSLSRGSAEPTVLTLPGDIPATSGALVVLENWGNATSLCVPQFEVHGRWISTKKQ